MDSGVDGKMGRETHVSMDKWEYGNVGKRVDGQTERSVGVQKGGYMKRRADQQMGGLVNGDMHRWKHGEMRRWVNGKMGRWEDNKKGRWVDGEMVRQRDGSMGG